MARIVVFHTGYGCDTGCCGHAITEDPDGESYLWDRIHDSFDFSHPQLWKSSNDTTRDAAIREYVVELVTEQLGAEHVADIDFDACLVVDD